jgi:dolichol-phosphate mannosyltransferase
MAQPAEKTISIVVPTYNEAENIPILLERIDRAVKEPYEVVIVDDNSPDGTAEVAKKMAERYPVKVVVRPGKLGLATAVVEGFKHAEGRYIVVMDADLQHPPEVIPALIQKLKEGYQLAIASRYVKGGKDLGLTPKRRMVSLGARYLAWLLLPQSRGVKDVMSGFFALDRQIAITDTRLRGYKILLEILSQKNPKTCEIPYEFHPRLKGASKLKTKEYINYILDLLKLSNYFTIKYILIALITAIAAKIVFPYVGFAALALGAVVPYVILRNDGLSILGAATSQLASVAIRLALSPISLVEWGIASLVKLFLVHVLRYPHD